VFIELLVGQNAIGYSIVKSKENGKDESDNGFQVYNREARIEKVTATGQRDEVDTYWSLKTDIDDRHMPLARYSLVELLVRWLKNRSWV
jgi:hypothetical protein